MDKNSEYCRELLRALTDDELFKTLSDVEAILIERGYRETPETLLPTDVIVPKKRYDELLEIEFQYDDLRN